MLILVNIARTLHAKLTENSPLVRSLYHALTHQRIIIYYAVFNAL